MARSTLFLKAGDLNRKQLMKIQKIDKKVLNELLASCTFKGLPKFEEEDYKKIHITKEMVKKVLDKVSDKDAEIIAQEVNRVAKKFHLDTELRLSHFFAQLKHESNGGLAVKEAFEYKTARNLKRLLRGKPYYKGVSKKLEYDINRFLHLKGEEKYKAIADKAYWHVNGNIKEHDGYHQLY